MVGRVAEGPGHAAAARVDQLDLLAGHRVPALLLKGTPVAHLYYDEPYQRVRCDTDLYINEEDVATTAGVLADHGYQVSGLGRRKYSSKQFGAVETSFQNVSNHFDVHWKLSNRVLFQAALPFEECHAERQPVPALGENAWTLSTTDLLLHACIHRIGHGRNTDRNRLLWLYDINLLWNGLDTAGQAQVIEKALDKKIGAMCADALEVCWELFKPNGGGIPVGATSVGAAPGRDYLHGWSVDRKEHREVRCDQSGFGTRHKK